jgi:hypothetical protein
MENMGGGPSVNRLRRTMKIEHREAVSMNRFKYRPEYLYVYELLNFLGNLRRKGKYPKKKPKKLSRAK